MLTQEPAVVLAGDSAALVLAWLACTIALRFMKAGTWRVAAQRALGLALICLAAFLALRQIMPDMFVLPLVFLAGMTVDVLTSIRLIRPTDRYIISMGASLSIVGVFSVVDAALRVAGYHLTAMI